MNLSKRIYIPAKDFDDEILAEINEMIIEYNTPDDSGSGSGGATVDGSPEGYENSDTIIPDATCAPQNISYPQGQCVHQGVPGRRCGTGAKTGNTSESHRLGI